jgi:murein DD-endopeptidase MepM/ murein hydrolase activator NlpD
MAEERFNSGRSLKIPLLIAAVLVLVFILLGIFRASGTPVIAINPAMSAIGRRTPVSIEVSEPRRGLAHIKIELFQGDNRVILEDKTYPCRGQFSFWGPKTEKAVLPVVVGREKLQNLAGGSATIRVTAERAGTWLRHPGPEIEEVTLPVRLTPPSIQVISTQTYVAQGGCEVVVYRVGQSAVRDGVRSGSWWFPGYPLPGGGKQDRFALFAVPYDMAQPDVRLVVEDAAGNQGEMGFIDKFFPKPFKSDNMEINDAFMGKVVPEILSQSPEIKDRGNLLDNYLAINRDLREKNADTIKALAQKSKPEFLWAQPFFMLPNGKVMASFADRRTYIYQGRTVDHQDHLGFDLAVTKQAPVPASNDGVVVYARFLGIYGNAIVIDHGYGLSTIYGHLSSISVTEGQKVARGDIIGRTGETGLAGGDHLHFCTILQGLPVNPAEWWDGHWIKDRIAKKLGPALQYKAP